MTDQADLIKELYQIENILIQAQQKIFEKRMELTKTQSDSSTVKFMSMANTSDYCEKDPKKKRLDENGRGIEIEHEPNFEIQVDLGKIKSHSKSKVPLQCPQCTKTMSTKASLRRHLFNIHGVAKK